MPKLSKSSAAHVDQMGPGTEWHDELDGYKASFVKVTADADLTDLLKGLPNDECPCPHWGYVQNGRIWFRSGDREDVYEAGDAFYVSPGHTSGAYADAEFLIFSPSDLMAEVESHMTARGRQLQGA